MIENPKRVIYRQFIMRPKSEWILYLALVACCALAVVGGLSSPLIEQGPVNILLYEIFLFICIGGILFLICRKGLPGT